MFLSKGISPLVAFLALLSIFSSLLAETAIAAYDFAESDLNVVKIDSLALNERLIPLFFWKTDFFAILLLFSFIQTNNNNKNFQVSLTLSNASSFRWHGIL